MESVGPAVTKVIFWTWKVLKNLEARETEFFAKCFEKCKILSEFFETKISSLDDYTCLKLSFW